ncbi:hypothetical protein QBC35DRAFT_94339 [Podospora australis]|uniref:RGS domain-containing protein n=1 Tax=Podospora australis TaxID=1536484 RepID=A0AAN7AL72_9PEZI|nr:hypothetical protein QBC35DRAFT_94339 [Podospora australis]
MSDFEETYQPDKPPPTQANLPDELSFEEVVKNQTKSPCSLTEFMDYLTHAEKTANSLHFFLWYWDYVQRWSHLLPRQKALSPAWDPEKALSSKRFITYSHKRARSLKMNKVITIMEMESEEHLPDDRSRSSFSGTSSVRSQSQPRTPILSPVEKKNWQPFTIQPFRDEISRITRQYISPSSPFLLPSLSATDRESCLRAAQHTTHPSALLPAFVHTEATLRNLSHPNFIQFSQRNANPPRILFLRLISAALLLLGITLTTVLILSSLSPYLRVLGLVFFWPGFTVLFASFKGCCILLHFQGRRQLRAWESSFSRSRPQARPASQWPLRDSYNMTKGHERKDTAGTTTTAIYSDTNSRKPSLQIFASRSDISREDGLDMWREEYEKKGLMEKIFDETVAVENRGLMLIQDKTVLVAVIWAGFLATGLVVGLLFAPRGGFF